MRWMLVLLAGCTSETGSTERTAADPDPFEVVSGSVPVHHLAQRLSSGQPWSVRLMPPPDADPGAWEPLPTDIVAAQDAALVLLNGAGYEAWSATAALPATRVVRTAADVPPLRREVRTHSHGVSGAHSHGAIDPHTWMDPSAYRTQARATHAALSALPGADVELLTGQLQQLEDELVALEDQLRAARPEARALASNHPAFGHLARRLELEITDFDIDPNHPAPVETTTAVRDWADRNPRPTLFWESEPSAAVRASLPGGVQHVVVDPLEHPPPGGRFDYIAQGRANVAVLGGLSVDAASP